VDIAAGAGATGGGDGGSVSIAAGGPFKGNGGSVTIAGSNAAGSGNFNGGNLILNTGSATGSGTAGSVQITGNVGIGTTSPQAPLHVVNGIQTTGATPGAYISDSISIANSVLGGATPATDAYVLGKRSDGNFVNGFYDSSVGGITGMIYQGNHQGFFGTTYSVANPISPQNGPSGIFANDGGLNLYAAGANVMFIDGGNLNHTTIGSWAMAYNFQRSRGAPGAPTVVQGGDTIGNLEWSPHDGTSWNNSTASISAIVDSGSISAPGKVPTKLVFSTTPNGSTMENQMVILGSGNVGVGTTSPGYKLDVNGDINIASGSALRFGGTSVCTSAGCTSSSDKTLKEHIQPLQGSLEKIVKLQGVEYDYKDKTKFTNKHQVGVIAQDVEKVYPEVVNTDSKSGLKAVAYDHLVAPLIEAFKTLYNRVIGIENHQASQDRDIASVKAENADLKAKAAKLEQENAEMKARLEKIEKMLNSK
jgi:hypothetical protein